MQLPDQVHALITAVLEDEANGPSGVTNVTGTAPIVSSGGATPAVSIPKATSSADGYLAHADWNTFNGKQDQISLTPGMMPIASGAHALADGPIDLGITSPGTLTVKNVDAGGTAIDDTGGGGIAVTVSGTAAPILLQTSGASGIQIEDIGAGGGGVLIQSNNGNIVLTNNGGPGYIYENALVVPGTVYSAAGTPLPAAASTPVGARAMVSDATANVYGTAYASGGSIVAPVYCDGSAWNMG